MAIQIHNLATGKINRKTKKRVGRGNASGRGTYSTRGMKGQRSRSGGKKGLKIKGFKKNLLNLPKFKGMKKNKPAQQVVSLKELNEKFANGEVVEPKTLLEKNLIVEEKRPVKILNNGDISVKIKVQDCLVSAGAKQAIEKAGGQVSSDEQSEEKNDKQEVQKETKK